MTFYDRVDIAGLYLIPQGNYRIGLSITLYGYLFFGLLSCCY